MFTLSGGRAVRPRLAVCWTGRSRAPALLLSRLHAGLARLTNVVASVDGGCWLREACHVSIKWFDV
jgi:hypothetical protein